MNAAATRVQEQRPRKRKEEKLQVRVEPALAKRLRLAAAQSDITASDKVRRILDAALPHTP